MLGKRLGYNKSDIAHRYLWINTTVRRVLQNEFYTELIKKRKAEIKEGIDMLDEIVRNGAISDTSLRMLVKKIIITERKGKLKIQKTKKLLTFIFLSFIIYFEKCLIAKLQQCSDAKL